MAEFSRNGYAVVLIDDGAWGERVDGALAALGVPPLPRAIGTEESLRRHAVPETPGSPSIRHAVPKPP